METTPDKVLRAATRLFAQRGYGGVSVRDICRAASVSMNAVHYHFKNKENLYRTILQEFAESRLESARRALRTPLSGAAEFRTRLHVFTEEMLTALLQEHELLHIAYTEFLQLCPHADDSFPRTLVHLRETLSAFISSGKETGIVRSDVDADIAASLVLLRIAHQVILSRVGERFFDRSIFDPAYREHWTQQNMDLFLWGMLGRK